MGEEYDNSNRGVMFKKQKEKESQPDYTGNIEPVCPQCGTKTDYWMSSWVQTMKSKDEKYFSISINAKDASFAKKPAAKEAPPPQPSKEFDDDLPF